MTTVVLIGNIITQQRDVGETLYGKTHQESMETHTRTHRCALIHADKHARIELESTHIQIHTEGLKIAAKMEIDRFGNSFREVNEECIPAEH